MSGSKFLQTVDEPFQGIRLFLSTARERKLISDVASGCKNHRRINVKKLFFVYIRHGSVGRDVIGFKIKNSTKNVIHAFT